MRIVGISLSTESRLWTTLNFVSPWTTTIQWHFCRHCQIDFQDIFLLNYTAACPTVYYITEITTYYSITNWELILFHLTNRFDCLDRKTLNAKSTIIYMFPFLKPPDMIMIAALKYLGQQRRTALAK